MKKYNLLSALEQIKNEYEKAKLNPIIHKPLSYALYQTWKFFDSIESSKLNDTQINIYNLKEIHNNCTVEVWGNTETGDLSVAWYAEGDYTNE